MQLVVEIVIFLILVGIGRFIYSKFNNGPNMLSKFNESFPEEEIHTLRQSFFLIMMSLAFINILYSLISSSGDLIYFVIFDVLFSLFVAITLVDGSSLNGKIMILLMVPFGSLNYLLFGLSLAGLVDIVHVLAFIYIIKIYYGKFKEYTKSNGLGIAIVVLFSLIFISFLFTQVAENVNPLDALVMVSNAFTSNGYAVLGSTIAGKLNSIVLVWGGYILSGVGTATLTAAILTKHFNNRFEELEELIKNNND